MLANVVLAWSHAAKRRTSDGLERRLADCFKVKPGVERDIQRTSFCRRQASGSALLPLASDLCQPVFLALAGNGGHRHRSETSEKDDRSRHRTSW